MYGISKKEILKKSFFAALFNYSPLIWMIHNRTVLLTAELKILHKRCLRLIYSNKTTSYEEVLKKDGPASLHYKNIQTLPAEISKIKNGMPPAIHPDIFLHWTGSHNNPSQP